MAENEIISSILEILKSEAPEYHEAMLDQSVKVLENSYAKTVLQVGDDYVIMSYCTIGDDFILGSSRFDRSRSALSILFGLGLAPEVLLSLPKSSLHESDILITSFAKGTSLSDAYSQENLLLLGESLSEVHQQTIPRTFSDRLGSPMSPLRFLQLSNSYLIGAQQIAHLLPEHQDLLDHSINLVSDTFALFGSKYGALAKKPGTTLVHGDLNLQNVLISEKNAVLVDWDYAGQAHLEFDVATVLELIAQRENDEEVFLERYPLELNDDRLLEMYRLVVNVLFGSWAIQSLFLVKAPPNGESYLTYTNGKLENQVSFLEQYATDRLKKAEKLLTS